MEVDHEENQAHARTDSSQTQRSRSTAGVDVFAGMTSTFSANGGVAASLSFGPLISILGVIAGLGAVVLMYREWQAGSKSGNPGKEIGLSLLGAILVGIILSSF